MDSKLDKLIEKYWNAETNLEEELELKKMIKSSSDPNTEDLDTLLNYFDQESHKTLDDSFDDEVLAMIEEENETKVVSFNDYFRKYASIAAAVVVMAVSSVMFIQNQNEYSSEETFDTPEEAYAALKEQLMMVSSLMNKGNNTVNELSALGSATDKIGEIGKMSSADASFELLKEMNVNN